MRKKATRLKPFVLKERPIHLATAAFLALAIKRPQRWWHTPNGEKRDPVTAALLERMGVTRGVPDFLLLRAEAARPYLLFIEMKAEDGRLDGDQTIMHDDLEECGAIVEVCRSVDHVERVLLEHGFTLHARVMGGGGIMKVAA